MRFWFKSCPRCHQGRLFVMQMGETGALFLHCEECEWAWDNPTQVDDPGQGRLGIDLDGEYASERQIEMMAWQAYAAHTVAGCGS